MSAGVRMGLGHDLNTALNDVINNSIGQDKHKDNSIVGRITALEDEVFSR